METTTEDVVGMLLLALKNLSLLQVLLLVIGAAMWLFGVRAVSRMNTSRSGTNGNDFNAREWWTLVIYSVASLAVLALAINLH